MKQQPGMAWIRNHVRTPKDATYAQRVLDRCRLGLKAHGAIQGVRIITGAHSCATCQALAERVYHPDEAPLIPIAGCTSPEGCCCAYTPAMDYELTEGQAQ